MGVGRPSSYERNTSSSLDCRQGSRAPAATPRRRGGGRRASNGQRPPEPPPQRRRAVGQHRLQIGRRAAVTCSKIAVRILALEGAPARRAPRTAPPTGPRRRTAGVGRSPLNGLGRHVVRRADEPAADAGRFGLRNVAARLGRRQVGRRACVAQQPRQTEVEQLRRTPRCVKPMLLGLMSQCRMPPACRCSSASASVMPSCSASPSGSAPGAQAIGQRAAGQELLDQKRRALPRLDAVDGRQVRMRDRGHRPRLVAQPRGVLGADPRQRLDRHVAAEIQVGGAIDHAHAAGADPPLEAEDAAQHVRRRRLGHRAAAGAARRVGRDSAASTQAFLRRPARTATAASIAAAGCRAPGLPRPRPRCSRWRSTLE